MKPESGHEPAARALALLDLTNLDDECTAGDIDALCARAVSRFGPVAAVCLWPAFVSQARQKLAGSGVRIATVVNFPHGGTDTEAVLEQALEAVADGADEIDLVMPYSAFLDGDEAVADDQIRRLKAALGTRARLKVILETGELKDAGRIAAASRLAIDAGADFIKTSTGKVSVNATPEAAEIMLTAIHEAGRPVGFKPAGGIRTLADANLYLGLADRILGPDWVTPETFRFGASGLLNALLADLEGAGEPSSDGAY